MTSKPLVDVLMPAYNAAATLRAAIDGLLAQTIPDIRIVVVDDGSSDETPSILAEYARADSRVMIETKPNSGIVDALNRGLALSKAKYVARMDADDIAYPDRMENQVKFLEANPECVAVGGLVDHIDETGQPVLGLPQAGDPTLADPQRVPAREPYIIHPFMMARREALQSVGGYRFVYNSEDSDLFWRLSETGTLHNLSTVLGKYRMHTGSISGATVLNGRIMAVSSQLAALSAIRRRSKRKDIVFERADMAAYRAAGSMESICALASRQLDPDEAEHLTIAAAIKLLELAAYRPYEPDVSDCTFIRHALAASPTLTRENQREVRWYVTVAAARLIRMGRIREAFALTPPAEYPIVAARAVLARGLLKRAAK